MRTPSLIVQCAPRPAGPFCPLPSESHAAALLWEPEPRSCWQRLFSHAWWPCAGNDIHGHLLPDVLHEIVTGEGDITGLEVFPTVVGLADGPTPAHALGALTPSSNWAGNVVWREPEVISPETLEELQTAVREADSLRMLGRSHSFTPMCDTNGVMINMAKMSSVLELDEVNGRITVEGGTYPARHFS